MKEAFRKRTAVKFEMKALNLGKLIKKSKG